MNYKAKNIIYAVIVMYYSYRIKFVATYKLPQNFQEFEFLASFRNISVHILSSKKFNLLCKAGIRNSAVFNLLQLVSYAVYICQAIVSRSP